MKLKLTCVTCHPAAQQSARLEDNLLPDGAVCKQCHEQVAIKKPQAVLLNRFPHRTHVALGSIAPALRAAVKSGAYLTKPGDLLQQLDASAGAGACGGCHRGLETSKAVSKANFPAMADCLVCHNKIDPPFSCEFCHDKSASLKPANHTTDFLDSHTRKNAPLDRTTCAVCHGRKFTCLGCH